MMSVLERLCHPDAVIIFDIDGVLAAYEYGDGHHNVCPQGDWPSYVLTHDVYADARPLPVIQAFIRARGTARVYVCSAACPEERAGKLAFVQRHYGIPEDHVLFVARSGQKLAALRALHERAYPGLPAERLAMVEDTVSVLDDIQLHSEYLTVHISSFFA